MKPLLAIIINLPDDVHAGYPQGEPGEILQPKRTADCGCSSSKKPGILLQIYYCMEVSDG